MKAICAYTPSVAIDAIRAAYDALGSGDAEPLDPLMDESMVWRGAMTWLALLASASVLTRPRRGRGRG